MPIVSEATSLQFSVSEATSLQFSHPIGPNHSAVVIVRYSYSLDGPRGSFLWEATVTVTRELII